MYIHQIKTVLTTASLLILLSCGGGGGAGEGKRNDGGGQQGDDVLNQGLSGKFFFGANGVTLLDASAGTYRVVPNTDYQNQHDRFPRGLNDIIVSPRLYNTSEFLVVASNLFGSHIYSQNYSGEYSTDVDFSLGGQVLGAGFSRDGQYIALWLRVGSSSNDPWLQIYTRSGTFLSEKQMKKRGFVWLPDNRLLYSNYREFHFTSPASTNDEQVLVLPDANGDETFVGTIGGKSVNKEGTKIAFTLYNGYGVNYGVIDSRLFMMNIDGTNVHKVATTYKDEDPKISVPSWSPDSRWIYVKEGFIPTTNPRLGRYAFGNIFIIPANGDKVYSLSENDSERSPEVKLLWRHSFGKEPDGLVTQATANTFTWIPDPYAASKPQE